MYLEGESIRGIRKWLNENTVESPRGANQWSESTVLGILKNEKYKGDVLLQKSYTVDYLTKTTAKNKGEVAQYYIENNHEGIVSREVFDMVQDEIKRRANLYSSKTPTKYSSKYALTGKVICGECGAKYRRVTWSRNGNKRIVWRCIERLTNGTQNCKNSPTIFEEDLHNTILDSLKDVLPKSDDIAKRVRGEIEAVMNKDDDNNPRVVRRRIQNLEKEAEILRNILRETVDKEYYTEKIKIIERELLKLNKTLLLVSQYKFQNIKCDVFANDVDIKVFVDLLLRDIIYDITVVGKGEYVIKYI